MNMYTQRFRKVATERSHSSTLSQFTQTPPPPETQKTVQSTQTSVSLDPNGKTAELIVLSSKQKVVNTQITEDKAVQTSTSIEGAIGGAMKGALTSRPVRDSQAQKASGDTKLPSPNFKAHSGAMPATNVPATRMQSEASNEGLRFSSVVDEEKRKKEDLLAKLRAIDSIKNPPESQPIESTAVRGSGFAGIGKHDSSESKKSLTSSETQSSQPADSALPVASGHTANIDLTTLGSSPNNTLQSSDNKSGIQNLLLGESQPFQPGLLKNSYHGDGNPLQSSFSTAEALRTSVDSKPTGNTPNTDTRSYSLQQGSLFNFNNRNLTKASTDLSSLMNGDDQTHGDSNMTSVAADLTKTHSTQPPAPVKKKPLPSFMSTSTSNGRRASSKKNKESPSISANRTPSNSSLQSWPDTVQNLHSGKPAYSTGTDPFGSKHIAVLAQKPPPVDKSEPREYKPLHGRRASSMFTDVMDDIPKHLELVSENHPGSTAHQKTANIKPRECDSYPWEIAIDVEADELLSTESPARSRKNRITSASKKSLLPLRPKQNESGFGMMPGAAFEADDLEEVVI